MHRPALDRVTGIIDVWLDEDRTRPPKQRHTGQRIFDRLKDEHGFTGSVSTVRRYVAHRQSTSGEVYFPLVFDPGEEAQVDWGEAWMVMNGVQTKVYLFCVRLCHSTASFVRAYRKSDQVSLLDGMVRAFKLFGGVPRRCAFDNMKSAVISVGKGRDRTLTTRFKELISHFLFEPRFCNVASVPHSGVYNEQPSMHTIWLAKETAPCKPATAGREGTRREPGQVLPADVHDAAP